MADPQVFDVVVVGAGPGGAAAAKRCAEKGLNTLLIEKKRLPRDKVCSGMVMGRWAAQTIEQEFGVIPRSVLTEPPLLAGHRFYVGEEEPTELKWPTALSWRKDLDFWLVQGALTCGVQLKDEVRVAGMEREKAGCRILLEKEGLKETLRARCVIGADGAVSIVRRSLFPELKVRFSGPIRECYAGELGLEKDVFHWFFPKGQARPRFNVNHKGDVFLIEGSGLRELRKEIDEILSPHGFKPGSEPLWKDGCSIALLHEPLLAGRFAPALENVLLVGDAGGLILPITYEGIGSALKSGLLAADAVIKHFEQPDKIAPAYLKSLKPLLDVIGRLLALQSGLKIAAEAGPRFLARSLADAYEETLTIQERFL